MENPTPPWTLGSLAVILGGKISGPEETPIARPAPAGSDDPLGIAFCESPKYLAKAVGSRAGALILKPGMDSEGKPAIYVDSPRLAFGMLLHLAARPLPLAAGAHATAVIDSSAEIAASAAVGPYVVIERGARIGPDVRIFPFCYVGETCVVEAGATLFPGVVLYQDVTVGPRSIVHAGAVLGADGFGFVWDGKRQQKVPQVGGVVLGEEVEVGANTTIDRATAGATVVGNDVKLDNQVQIAHNVDVGDHTVVASQSGVSGSTKLGKGVVLAGQTGVADHLTIADGVILGARASALGDIPEAGAYIGHPARPMAQGKRALVLAGKLPEMLDRIRALERKIEELEAK